MMSIILQNWEGVVDAYTKVAGRMKTVGIPRQEAIIRLF